MLVTVETSQRFVPERWRAAGLSDEGQMRPKNEDAFRLLTDRGYFIVADGVGGGHAGETAAKIVVETLPRMLVDRFVGHSSQSARLSSSSEPSRDPIEKTKLVLRDTIVELSQLIWKQSAGQPGLAGMGSTLVLACIRGDHAYIAHMGDSRAYRYRQDALEPLTQDHSVVGILLRDGKITEEEARRHPARGSLSRFMGMESVVYPDVQDFKLATGDRLLLCSDGLTGMLSDKDIARTLERVRDPEAACQAMVKAANGSGGKDNITVVVAEWLGS